MKRLSPPVRPLLLSKLLDAAWETQLAHDSGKRKARPWSANETLRRIRAQGGAVRRADFLEIWKEARRLQSEQHKISRPLAQTARKRDSVLYPVSHDSRVASLQRRKWFYSAQLIVRHVPSSTILVMPWGWRTRRLISWRYAMRRIVEDAREQLAGRRVQERETPEAQVTGKGKPKRRGTPRAPGERSHYAILAVIPMELRRYERLR